MDETTRAPALFSTFVMGLASAALIELGIVEDPQSKQKRFRKDQARSHIDLLAMLQEKTVGNLTTEEKELIERVLVDLRLQFAKAAR
jgi:hypothetical protein